MIYYDIIIRNLHDMMGDCTQINFGFCLVLSQMATQIELHHVSNYCMTISEELLNTADQYPEKGHDTSKLHAWLSQASLPQPGGHQGLLQLCNEDLLEVPVHGHSGRTSRNHL